MIFKKLVKILSAIIDMDCDDITPETELSINYGVEAVDIAKLIIECEKHFKITVYDEDVHTFKCVNDIVEYIERQQYSIS